MERVPKPETIALLDKVVVPLQEHLAAEIPWLDYSFGRSQKLALNKNGNNFYYPAVHIEQGKYISMMPDQKLGNYSFFTIDDPQEYIPNGPTSKLQAKGSIIFWFNLDAIFSMHKDRNTEPIKEQVLDCLTKRLRLQAGRLEVLRVHETAENIYKGYSFRELDSQFLMQPFAGLKIDCLITYIHGLC